jgi:hypothetical protein
VEIDRVTPERIGGTHDRPGKEKYGGMEERGRIQRLFRSGHHFFPFPAGSGIPAAIPAVGSLTPRQGGCHRPNKYLTSIIPYILWEVHCKSRAIWKESKKDAQQNMQHYATPGNMIITPLIFA